MLFTSTPVTDSPTSVCDRHDQYLSIGSQPIHDCVREAFDFDVSIPSPPFGMRFRISQHSCQGMIHLSHEPVGCVESTQPIPVSGLAKFLDCEMVEMNHWAIPLFRHQFRSNVRPGNRGRPVMAATIEFFQESRIIHAPDFCVGRNRTHEFTCQLQAFLLWQLQSRFPDLLTADIHEDTFLREMRRRTT